MSTADARPAGQHRHRHRDGALRRALGLAEIRLVVLLLIGAALLAGLSPAFLTGRNLSSVLLGFSFVGIAALGQLLVIIAGRIDLSSGSVMGLAGMICAIVATGGGGMWAGIAAGLVTGAACGVFNAVFTVRFGITSFIVTLGSMQIARGITVGLTEIGRAHV